MLQGVWQGAVEMVAVASHALLQRERCCLAAQRVRRAWLHFRAQRSDYRFDGPSLTGSVASERQAQTFELRRNDRRTWRSWDDGGNHRDRSVGYWHLALIIQSVVRLAMGAVIVLVAMGAVGIATAILSSSLALLVSVG